MRIGVDASCWWSLRGFGRFTRELFKAMFELPGDHTFVLFVDHEPTNEMKRDNVEVVHVKLSQYVTDAAVSTDSRSPGDLLAFTKEVKKQNLDILYFPAVYSWFPVPFGLKNIVTFHDAIAEHFPDLIFPGWKGRLFWKIKMKLAIWQSTRIMTVSHAAKKEIIEHLGIKSEKIDVITEAAEARFKVIKDVQVLSEARSHCNIPQGVQYICYVGGLAPHKNLLGLMKGFLYAQKKIDLGNLHMVLIGDPEGDGFHSNYRELLDMVENNKELTGKVHFTGYVSDEDLIALYSDAYALVLPSFSEGFGLPAIEAMSCDTPVLASNQASLPEVVGNAGIYFDPYNINDIGEAIVSLVSDEDQYAQLKSNAISRSKEFTWERAAQMALDDIKRAINN